MESQNNTKVVENSAGFQKGHEKIGGRTKGTPNKSTRLKNEVFDILDSRKAEIKEIPILDLLRVAASLVPREVKADLNNRVYNIMPTVKINGNPMEIKVGD